MESRPAGLELLPGESLIDAGTGRRNSVWLTDRRIVQERRAGLLGRDTEQVSIPLEQISSIHIGFLRRRPLLVVAVVSLAIAVFTDGALSTVFWIAGVAALAAFILYARRGLIIRGSGGAAIRFLLSGLGAEQVYAFIGLLEEARQARAGES